MSKRQNPRTMAIAYKIRSICEMAGWSVTLEELADSVSEYFNDTKININVIRGICASRRKEGHTWLDLIRVTSPSGNPGSYSRSL